MDISFKKNETKNFSQIKKISGKIVYISESYLKVKVLDSSKYGYCLTSNLTDFNRQNMSYFLKNPDLVLDFLVLKETYNKFYLSYKAIHPEEILLKFKPINTNSYFKNLNEHLSKKINEYSFD